MYKVPNKPEIIYSVRSINMKDYSTYLFIIAFLLFLNLLNNISDRNTEAVKQAVPTPSHDVIPASITHTMGGEPFENLYRFTNNSSMSSYKLIIQDEDHFVLTDRGMVIHTFSRDLNPNCDVFRVIDSNNR